MKAADLAVWRLVREEVAPKGLRDAVVERYIAEVTAEKPAGSSADLKREEAKLSRLTAAISDPDAGDVAELIKARKEVQARIADLKARSARTPTAEEIAEFREVIREYVDGALGAHYPDADMARPLLAGILAEPIVFEKGGRFTFRASFGRVLEGFAQRTFPAARGGRS